ncbi:MAG TPA: PIG-L family deacetylase [Thermomicrobiales bacterium]|nr:PIG-L family deacetylase [Thermomicrobiales bacterium]
MGESEAHVRLSTFHSSPPTILATFAHPDDEAFGSGGTFARYAAAGSRVVLVCATRGEVGEISDAALATPETLGDVREGELRCAAAALGISEVILLGYRDSGMVGTADNADERAYVNAPSDEVVHRLTGVIRAERPSVIVTFDPTGAYGHPDHIAIHHHSVAALRAAADEAFAPELGPSWQAARLAYVALPRSAFRQMRDALAAQGDDVTMFERFEEAGVGSEDDELHIRIDVSAHVDAKNRAFECHRTQFGGDSLFERVPAELMRQIMSQEYFTLGWPARTSGDEQAPLLDGLLAGL